MDKKVGFIGLGIMGKPMAINLVKAGYEVLAYDLSKEASDSAAQSGVTICDSIEAVTKSCSDIITMLPNSPHVKQAVLGEGGVAEFAVADTLIIDMSSIAPDASKEIHAALTAKKIRMIDAPVSGGEPKAIEGTLAIMVGGDESDFNRAKPLFDIMGANSVLVGDIGSGNICKLVNQVIVALNISAVSEGMMLAKKAGTDPQKVYEAIRGGLAGSTVMDAKVPMMLNNNFNPGFRVGLHIKDLDNALETGASSGSPLPLTASVMQILQVLKADGELSSDHSAIAKYYEKLADCKLHS